MKKSRPLPLFAAFLLMAFCSGALWAEPKPKKRPVAEPPKGRAVFLGMNCNECHAVSTAGVRAGKKARKRSTGTDLSQLPKAKLKMTPASLRIHRTTVYKRIKKAPTTKFKGTDEELQAIVDWLLEQKSE